MIVAGHKFSVWRTPREWGYKLEAKCKCGFWCIGLTYEEIATQTADHFEEKLREQELELEEREHELHG